MSFMIPKKPQILYSPMLATFGGGSARGFNPGGNAFASGYFGVGYSGFNNSNPILAVTTNAGTPTAVTPGSNVWESLDTHLDYDAGTVWGSYNTVSQYTMTQTGTYTDDTFYKINGAAPIKSNLSGAAASSVAALGRGQTVAYLSDASRTPVLVAGLNGTSTGTAAGNGLAFFNYSTGAFLGRMTFDPGVTPAVEDISGLAWDGDHLLAVSRTTYTVAGQPNAKLFRIVMPSSVVNGGSLTTNVFSTTNLPILINYGMAWYGAGVYMTGRTTGISQISIDFQNNTSALVGAEGKFGFPTAVVAYGATLDYKNRRLVLGGYATSNIRSFGE